MQHAVLDPGEVKQLDTPKPFLLEARFNPTRRAALRWIKQLHVRGQVLWALARSTPPTWRCINRCCAPLRKNLASRCTSRKLTPSMNRRRCSRCFRCSCSHWRITPPAPAQHAAFALFRFWAGTQRPGRPENASQQAIIVSGKEQWDEAWLMLQRSKRTQKNTRMKNAVENAWLGIDLPALQARLENIWMLFSQIGTSRSRKPSGWHGLRTRLMVWASTRELAASDREASGDSVWDALRALVLSECVVGIEVVDYAQFIADLGNPAGTPVQEPWRPAGMPCSLARWSKPAALVMRPWRF